MSYLSYSPITLKIIITIKVSKIIYFSISVYMIFRTKCTEAENRFIEYADDLVIDFYVFTDDNNIYIYAIVRSDEFSRRTDIQKKNI